MIDTKQYRCACSTNSIVSQFLGFEASYTSSEQMPSIDTIIWALEEPKSSPLIAAIWASSLDIYQTPLSTASVASTPGRP
jgi:hypothetical protein